MLKKTDRGFRTARPHLSSINHVMKQLLLKESAACICSNTLISEKAGTSEAPDCFCMECSVTLWRRVDAEACAWEREFSSECSEVNVN